MISIKPFLSVHDDMFSWMRQVQVEGSPRIYVWTKASDSARSTFVGLGECTSYCVAIPDSYMSNRFVTAKNERRKPDRCT